LLFRCGVCGCVTRQYFANQPPPRIAFQILRRPLETWTWINYCWKEWMIVDLTVEQADISLAAPIREGCETN
jgi:hypothetical protein